MPGHRHVYRPSIAWVERPCSRGQAAEQFLPRVGTNSASDFFTLVLPQRHIWDREGGRSRGDSCPEMAARLSYEVLNANPTGWAARCICLRPPRPCFEKMPLCLTPALLCAQANSIKPDESNAFAKAKAAVANKAGAAPRRFGTALSVNSNNANNGAIAPAGKAAPSETSLLLLLHRSTPAAADLSEGKQQGRAWHSQQYQQEATLLRAMLDVKSAIRSHDEQREMSLKNPASHGCIASPTSSTRPSSF